MSDDVNPDSQNNDDEQIKIVISGIESLTDQVRTTSDTLMALHKKSGSPENANKIERLRRAIVEEDLPRSIKSLKARLNYPNRPRSQPAPSPSSHNILFPLGTSVPNNSVPDLARTSVSNDSDS